jgi:hypothetical protein
MTFDVELTDTFGGEANYSWVTRAAIDAPATISDRALMRRAKIAAGLQGVRGEWASYGDTLEFKPYHRNIVLFVTARA